jgi:hypothetical protein
MLQSAQRPALIILRGRPILAKGAPVSQRLLAENLLNDRSLGGALRKIFLNRALFVASGSFYRPAVIRIDWKDWRRVPVHFFLRRAASPRPDAGSKPHVYFGWACGAARVS